MRKQNADDDLSILQKDTVQTSHAPRARARARTACCRTVALVRTAAEPERGADVQAASYK